MKQDFRPEVAPVQQNAGLQVARRRRILPWLLGAGTLLVLIGFGAAAVLAVRYFRPPLTWHLVAEVDSSAPDREAAVRQTVDVFERRLDAYGVSNFQIVPQGNGRILLSLPGGVKDPERLKSIIAAGGKLELLAVISPPSPAPVQTYATKEEAIASLNGGGTIPANRRILSYQERNELSSSPGSTKWVVVETPAIVNGSELRDASAARAGSGSNDYEIDFRLNMTGADKFGRWTGANINQYLGVALNDELKSIAFIRSQIFDQGQITGRFTKESAEDLALVLKSGALPAPITFIEERIDK
jgi:preprotein translocase subunit SecD